MMRNHNKQIVAILSLLFVVFNCGVNTQESDKIPTELQPHNQPSHRNNPKLARAKRMYALCPPDFRKIGNDCFYISKKKYNWLDAHFECKDRNSKLAEPMKFADRRLRKYLQNRDEMLGEKWIGGMYNHQRNKWKWGYNGGEMKYQAFDDGVEGSNLEYHCTVMDPQAQYKWTARKCTELHYFICQHRMSLVNDKQRQRVYTKWNETYPDQIANTVEIYVSTNGKNNRSNFYRKRNRLGMNRLNRVNNELQKANTTSSTPAPDYLPYNVYSKLETFQQKPQEDIHPINSAPNVKLLDQASLKQRKRHSLKLSGNVDLGLKKRKRTKGKKIDKKNKVNEIVPQQSIIDENNNNDDSGRQHHKHHHHNHHHHPNNALPETEIKAENERESKPVFEFSPVLEFLTRPPEPVERTTASTTTTTTTKTVSSSTVGPAIIERTTMSELRKKLEEKAQRRERLKEKLAKLSPEERKAFLLMKQQRADARRKGFKIGSSSSS